MPDHEKQLALAALTFEIEPSRNRIQLLPYGEFKAVDGRPFDVPAWYLTEQNGRDVADLANQSRTQLVVDYEHQTLHKEQNGQPAPAAGWMNWFEFTPQGLFAEVSWTDKAAKLIQEREYRYISAVFAYDTKGFVRKLFHAALTNTPALDGLDEVIAGANTLFFQSKEKAKESKEMKELLQQLLGLPDAQEDELKAALNAVLAAKPADESLSADTFARLAALSQKTEQPDLTQFAPVSVVQALQKQIAALNAEREADKGSELIEAALTAGKLLPAQKQWAFDVLKQPNGLAFLSSFIENAAPVAALTQTQTQATKACEHLKQAALSIEEKAAAKMLGMSEAEFAQIHHSIKE